MRQRATPVSPHLHAIVNRPTVDPAFNTPPLLSLQLCKNLDYLAKPHMTSIDRKSPIASGFQPFDFYHCLRAIVVFLS
jgi:hypothetical protein